MSLILLPNLLDEEADIDLYFPKKLQVIVKSLNGLIAESEKQARRYLLKFLSREELQEKKIMLLNEHSSLEEVKHIVKQIDNSRWGVISDAGLSCIADPGALLVQLAKKQNISIKAISGPSSIFLALLLSGLNAQNFAFNGYLPRQQDLLIKKIQLLEDRAYEEKSTQIFIEAPYRSDKMYKILKDTLKQTTSLCIAISLTSSKERVITKKVQDFPDIQIGKAPCVFLFQA